MADEDADLGEASGRLCRAAKDRQTLVATYEGGFICASSVLASALKAVMKEREDQADMIRLLEDDLLTARLLYSEAVIAEGELTRLLGGDLFTAEFTDPDKVEAAEIGEWVREMHRPKPLEMEPPDILAWEMMAVDGFPAMDYRPPDAPPPALASREPDPPPLPPTKRTRAGRKGREARKTLATYKEARGLH